MAFWVEENAIICLISATVTSPLNVMAMPSCELRNLAGAKRAEAILLFPEVEQRPLPFQVVYHLYVKPFFKVPFPFRVVGIGFAANFDVPFNRDAVCLYQPNCFCPLTSENFSCKHPVLPPIGLEVFLPDPRVRLVWVPPLGPLP